MYKLTKYNLNRMYATIAVAKKRSMVRMLLHTLYLCDGNRCLSIRAGIGNMKNKLDLFCASKRCVSCTAAIGPYHDGSTAKN